MTDERWGLWKLLCFVEVRAAWRCLVYVIRHKWFVFVECARLGVVWQGIVHDLSKFRPYLFLAYAAWFFQEKLPSIADMSAEEREAALDRGDCFEAQEETFRYAFLMHLHSSPHHWQYWVSLGNPDRWWKMIDLDPFAPGPFFVEPVDRKTGNPAVEDGGSAHFAEVLYGPGDDSLATRAYSRALLLTDALNRATAVPLIMPEKYIKEMVADWRGAGKAQGKPDTIAWFEEHRETMHLHWATEYTTELLLGI